MGTPRTVLVTGGTCRLGKAIAERLRADGWRVLTTSHRADAGADIVADFTDPRAAVKCYAAAIRLLDGRPPDALVNNAALFVGTDGELDLVNREAPEKLTVLMSTREEGRGAVVNVLDARVLDGREPATAYERTKAALLAHTGKSARLYVETLRVNAVAPGPVLPPTQVRELAADTPLGRPTPGDVADAVSFLLSARATTGAVLPVDGGAAL